MYDRSNPLAFVHIPKTAGTSFAIALSNALEENCTSLGVDQSVFGSFDKFDEFREDHRNIVCSDLAPNRNAKLLSGHLCLNNFRNLVPHAQFVTVFREPITRLISLWLYWRGKNDEQLEGLGGWAERIKLARGSLYDFVSRPELMSVTDNVYARTLLWPNDHIPNHCAISRANDDFLLKLTLTALQAFELCLAVEDELFDCKLDAWLGYKVEMGVYNETKKLSPGLTVDLASEISEAAILLGQRTRIDRLIWEKCFDSRRADGYAARSLADQFKKFQISEPRTL